MLREHRGRILRAAVTLVILGLMAWRLDLRASWDLLREVRPGPVGMAIALLAASHALVALVWRFLLERTGLSLTAQRSIRLYYAGLFLNNFFLGSVGGDSYRVWGARQAAGTGRRALAATLVERIVGVVALLLVGMVAAFAAYRSLPGSFVALLLGLSGGGALAGLTVVFFPDTVRRLGAPVLRRLPEWFSERAAGVLDGMRSASGGGGLWVCLLILVAAQGTRIWTHWWCAQALGLDIQPGVLYVAIPLVAVAAGLPISIGGLGVREWTGVMLLAPQGVAHPEAVAIEFLAYLVGVATSLLGGLAFLFGREARPPKDLGSSQESATIEP